jgi:hypothetical protein
MGRGRASAGAPTPIASRLNGADGVGDARHLMAFCPPQVSKNTDLINFCAVLRRFAIFGAPGRCCTSEKRLKDRRQPRWAVAWINVKAQ